MSHPKMLLLRVQMFPEPKHWDANQRLPREHWLHKPGLRWNLPGFGVHMAAACCSYGVSRCFKSQGPTHRPRNPHSFPAWKRQTSSNHGDFRVSCSHVTAGPLFPHASAVLPVKWSHTRPWKPRPTCWISYVSKCLKMSQNVSKCLKMSQNHPMFHEFHDFRFNFRLNMVENMHWIKGEDLLSQVLSATGKSGPAKCLSWRPTLAKAMNRNSAPSNSPPSKCGQCMLLMYVNVQYVNVC